MTEHREQLRELEALEAGIRRARSRECDLEVERIAADLAVKAGAKVGLPDIAPETADRIARALDAKRASERSARDRDARLGLTEEALQKERERLGRGLDALRAWRGDRGSESPSRATHMGHHVLLVATIATLAIAFTVHLAFLVILVPLGATSALLWSGNDRRWRRVGAKRRFEEAGLKAPKTWEEEAVSVRIGELEADLETVSARREAPDPGNADAQREGDTTEAEEAERELSGALEAAGLPAAALDAGLEKQIRVIAEAHQAARALEEAQEEVRDLSERAERIRSAVYRHLSSHGVAPPGGRADSGSMSEALREIEKKQG